MKTITVPKDSIAQNRLNYDSCDSTELIELNLETNILSKLFAIGFFNSINQLTNSMIDDFEDQEIVQEELLNKVINSDLFDRDKYDTELNEIACRIKELFTEAYNRKTGIYFFF